MVACGGTGGHIYPALAVAEAMRRIEAGAEIRFVGSAAGPESRMVPAAGFEFAGIPVAGLRGKSARSLMKGLVLLPRALFAALRHVIRFRPDAVLGTGGFASGPVLLAASLLRIPTVIQEQNRRLGWTNRVLSRLASKVAVSFQETANELGKGVVTGNPVREAFFEIPEVDLADGKLHVLVFGGSQGSRTLNRAVVGALGQLIPLGDRLVLQHQTGPREFDQVQQDWRKAGAPDSWEVTPYIDPMSDAFAKADLIVCRSGASTVAELCAAGRGAVLVPFPYATGDHQTENALSLTEHGAAVLVSDEDMSGSRLAEIVRNYMNHPEQVIELASAARSLRRPGASDAIANILRELATRRAS